MPESQLVKYSEQKSQDYLTDKTRDGKSFLKNCGILWKGVLEPLTHVCTDLKISKESNVLIQVMIM